MWDLCGELWTEHVVEWVQREGPGGWEKASRAMVGEAALSESRWMVVGGVRLEGDGETGTPPDALAHSSPFQTTQINCPFRKHPTSRPF